MDSRVPKRRRTTPRDLQPTELEVAAASRPPPTPAAPVLPSSPTPQELWRAAKAQSRGYKKRTKPRGASSGIDPAAQQQQQQQQRHKDDDAVYDDFDGANVGLEPYGRIATAAQTQSAGENSGGTRADSGLRRASGAPPAGSVRAVQPSSPVPSPHPSKGFFRRFIEAKRSSQGNRTAEREGRVNGEARDAGDEEDEGDDTHPSYDSTPRSSGRKRKVPAKFRDGESVELADRTDRPVQANGDLNSEEVAVSGFPGRQDAGGDPPSARVPGRPRTQVSPPSLAGESGIIERTKEQTRTPSKGPRGPKPLDRRKTNRPDSVSTKKDIRPLDDTNNSSTAEITHNQAGRLEQSDRDAFAKDMQVSKNREDLSDMSLKETELEFIQGTLLERATGARPLPLMNMDEEHSKVSSVVEQTITAGESNSILLLGARGTGKSALINHVIREQATRNGDDFHVVRLNGFIHTDDKIALREIWRQLGREMELETDQSTAKNYADTLTTLLALLSHPAEMGHEQPGQITKSVIFILDEFDLFTHHPRQTLLYNLFDIAQSRKAPIAVIGLTAKIDVVEVLEKRVRSRFSHRYVHLSLAKSFDAYEQMCKRAMTITIDELTAGEKSRLRLKDDVGTKPPGAKPTATSHVRSCIVDWNAVVEHIFTIPQVGECLRRFYYTTKSVPDFLTCMFPPVAQMPVSSVARGPALYDHFATAFASRSALTAPDSKLLLLDGLSTLQLALLVCAARLTAIYDADHISFALAYDEYKTLASKAKLQASASGALAHGAATRVFGKEIAKRAWEELLRSGLVLEDGRTASGGRVDVGLEEIGMAGLDLGPWAKWCKEI